MKTPLKSTAALTAAIVAGFLAARLPLSQAQVATLPPAPIQNPVPVVVNPTPKQYRVIDIGKIPVAKGQTATGTLETVLNDMGNLGWIVAGTTGSFVIMMQ